MSKEECRQEIGYYVADLFEYLDNDDMKSCLIMARGLVKMLVEYAKSR